MVEKVSPYNRNKIVDRIAGAIMDLAYKNYKRVTPLQLTVDVNLSFDKCRITLYGPEKLPFTQKQLEKIVHRIYKPSTFCKVESIKVGVIKHNEVVLFENNSSKGRKSESTGIYVGMPITEEERVLAGFAEEISERYPREGKYIYDTKSKTLILLPFLQDEFTDLNKAEALEEELNALYNLNIIVRRTSLWL